MTDLACSVSSLPSRVARRPGLLARFYRALIAARMAQARREIAMHLHLVPLEQRLKLKRELDRGSTFGM
jgi:hypothetical protein